MSKKKKKNSYRPPVNMTLMEGGILAIPGVGEDDIDELEFLPPTPEQLTLFIRDTQSPSVITKLNAVYDLLEDILDEDDYAMVIARLRDRKDRLTLETLFPAIREAVAGSAKFPTKPSSDSAPSQTSTGRRSTGRVQPEVLTPESSTSLAS